MAMSTQTVLDKVGRLLDQHAQVSGVVDHHEARLADAQDRLAAIAGDLRMFSHHPAVDGELFEEIVSALGDNGAADDAVEAPAEPVKAARKVRDAEPVAASA